MSLIVETGSGSATAESYESVAGADTYHLAHGAPTTWSAASTARKEEALRRATQYLDSTQNWKGSRKLSTQSLNWPRVEVTDDDNFAVASNSLPAKLLDATAELALKQISGELLTDSTDPGIKRESVKVGSLATDTTYGGVKSNQTTYALVKGLLKHLIRRSNVLQRA